MVRILVAAVNWIALRRKPKRYHPAVCQSIRGGMAAMDRRTFITATGAAAGAFVLAREGQAAHDEHAHHHGAAQGCAPRDALVRATAECIGRGEVCLAHCIDLLATGDTMLAECARRVNEMVALCGALRTITAQGAPSLRALALVTDEVCRTCEEECRKHEDHHAQCRDCAEACAACRRECAAVAT
jgi:Cys-rich four helix bundle protein (predicted Tat secretion target)